METIILALVVFAISSLFKGNKKQEQKPMPPFNQSSPTQTIEQPKQQSGNNRPRSLEDFAKEVFQQLNEKTQPMMEPVPSNTSMEQKAPDVKNTTLKEEVLSKPVSNRPAFNESRMSDRASGFKNGGQSRDPIKGKEIGSVVPTSRAALVQAMITSEILAQPVSKRRRS